MEIMTIIRGIIGMALLVSIGLLFSNNRKKVSWALVGKGLLLQLFFAISIIHSETLRGWFFILGWIKDGVSLLGAGVVKLLDFITIGSEFIFGSLATPVGTKGSIGFFFAFQVLPTILFFAALTSVLYYLGILQAIVKVMAKVMAKLLGTSGAESLSNTANIFLKDVSKELKNNFIGHKSIQKSIDSCQKQLDLLDKYVDNLFNPAI